MFLLSGARRAAVTVLAALCLGTGADARAANNLPLDRFLDRLTTWQAEFKQELRDARGRVQSRTAGLILVARPGRFRWEIRADQQAGPRQYTQVLIADGRNLWFYDRELAQVTVKPAASALSGAPAALLAGGGDWRAQFTVRALPTAAGLDWVEVRPRGKGAEFRDARLGFARGVELRRMVLRDNLGQVADIEFRASIRNPVLDRTQLEFQAPSGVDVIGVPLTGP